MGRWWRVIAIGAAVGLSGTACGGENAPAPAAALTGTPTPGSSASVGAGQFQALLDRLVLDRALARTDRTEAAARFNDPENADRPAAMDSVKAACAALLGVYAAFETDVRALTLDESVIGDVDALIDVSGRLRAVLAEYADAATPEEFRGILADETVATAVWEETVNGIAAALGTRGLTAPSPGATPSGTGSATPTATGTPTPSPGP